MFTTKTVYRFLPAATLILTILALSCYAREKPQQKPQEEPDANRIRVTLSVSAKDEFRGEATSYLTRALREFKDIDIVDELPALGKNFQISVILIKNIARNDMVLGYSMATIVSRDNQYTTKYLMEDVFTDFNPVIKALLTVSLTDYEKRLHFSLHTGPTLKELIESIIADIDGTIFEDARKDIRKAAADEAAEGKKKD